MNRNTRNEPAAAPPDPRPTALAPAALLQRQADADRRTIRAQVELLGDESPTVVASVRKRLARGGPRVERALERATESENPHLRMRARDLLSGFHRADVLRRLVRRVSRQRVDLESALFLLANLADESFDARPYRRALDAMADEVRRRMEAEPDLRRKVLELPAYLGGELGYEGAETDYHHPDNIHLFRTIERRKGMPLTLAALYALVARRAGIEAALIGMPGHVLLRLYYGPGRSLIIDPFQGGALRTRADCIAYLRQCDLVPQPEWFADASDESMFLRHLMNLVNSNRMRGHARRAREVRHVAEVLAYVQSQRQPSLRD